MEASGGWGRGVKRFTELSSVLDILREQTERAIQDSPYAPKLADKAVDVKTIAARIADYMDAKHDHSNFGYEKPALIIAKQLAPLLDGVKSFKQMRRILNDFMFRNYFIRLPDDTLDAIVRTPAKKKLKFKELD